MASAEVDAVRSEELLARNFHVEPSGRLLLVANQAADTVAVFRIDGRSGALEPAGEPVAVAGLTPSFVGVLRQP